MFKSETTVFAYHWEVCWVFYLHRCDGEGVGEEDLCGLPRDLRFHKCLTLKLQLWSYITIQCYSIFWYTLPKSLAKHYTAIDKWQNILLLTGKDENLKKNITTSNILFLQNFKTGRYIILSSFFHAFKRFEGGGLFAPLIRLMAGVLCHVYCWVFFFSPVLRFLQNRHQNTKNFKCCAAGKFIIDFFSISNWISIKKLQLK